MVLIRNQIPDDSKGQAGAITRLSAGTKGLQKAQLTKVPQVSGVAVLHD
jgi:hypothetical protein